MDFAKINNLNEFIERFDKLNYYWSLVTDIQFIAHNVLPKEIPPTLLADFFIDLPNKYSKKISISISQEPDVATREGKGEGRLE